MTCGRVGPDLIPDLWGKALWEEVLCHVLETWDSVRLRTASTQWNISGRYGPHGELFFFLLKKEPLAWAQHPSRNSESCALIGLRMTAEENAWRSVAFLRRQVARVKTTWVMARWLIGLRGSGDTITLFVQDWEVAKVVLSCHIALDVVCEDMHEVERRRGWFGF